MTDYSGIPWPFAEDEDHFVYTVNVEPARRIVHTPVGQWGGEIIDIDDDYERRMALRREILAREPDRAITRPGTEAARWEYLLLALGELARSHPDWAELTVDGDRVRWHNGRLDSTEDFRIGDPDSLSMDPLVLASLNLPSDLLIISEHDDGHLHLDSAVVTFPGAWSVTFDAGMSMHEIHSPVPELTDSGMTDRLEAFMRRMSADRIYRRVNWAFALTDDERLDTSLEAKPEWGEDSDRMVREHDWGGMRLRLELEHFIRLPVSGSMMFDIRTYFLPLEEVRRIDVWRRQLCTILQTVAEPIAVYKGFSPIRDNLVAWLDAPMPAAAGAG